MELEILGGYEGANPQRAERIERLGEDRVRVSPESEDGDSNYKFAFEIKVKNHPRRHGTSKYGWKRYVRGMLDLLTVVFITRFSRRPMQAWIDELLAAGVPAAPINDLPAIVNDPHVQTR